MIIAWALAVSNFSYWSSIDGRGKAVHLLKPSSKHKRKRSEIEDVKEEEELLNKDKQKYLDNVKKLKRD